MGQRYTVRLALSTLFSIVFGEYRLESNKRQAGVHEGVAQMRRAMLDHVAAVLSLTGLVVPRL